MSEIIARLRAAGIEGAESEARKLSEQFSGDALEIAIERRVNREPMSHILGYRDFWRDRFIVTKNVLDPRPDSELFIDIALQSEAPETVLDLGSGSGALGLSVLREFPNAHCVFADISIEALGVAKQNAENLQLSNRSRFIQSDWFSNIEEKFNLLLCNPPYIRIDEMPHLSPELSFEPPIALTPGGDGLAPYRIIAEHLSSVLTQNGRALFEHGFEQQDKVAKIFASKGFSTRNHADLSKNPRIVEVF